MVTGPYLPDSHRADLDRLARELPAADGRPAVVVEAFRPDLGAHLGGAALSVSQAGYNTVLELIAHRVRAVVVPYEASGDEQPLRAGLLAARGLLDVLPGGRADAGRGSRRAMDAALERPGFPAPVSLDPGGAARSVEILARLAAGVRRRRGLRRPAGARSDGSGGRSRPRPRRGSGRGPTSARAARPGRSGSTPRAGASSRVRSSTSRCSRVLVESPQARSRCARITRPRKRVSTAGSASTVARSPSTTRSVGGPQPGLVACSRSKQ